MEQIILKIMTMSKRQLSLANIFLHAVYFVLIGFLGFIIVMFNAEWDGPVDNYMHPAVWI